jgi:Domain of unknown function (DUF3883)
MSLDWKLEEVAATVAAYLQMLTLELTGQAYNKSEHRRALRQLLPGRSEGAIEFKHGNISAVMIELGYPYIRGYLPRKNFQRQALFEEVTQQIAARPQLEDAAGKAVELPAAMPLIERFDTVRVEPPTLELKVREPDTYRPSVLSQRDYLQREARNQSLGLAGEEFVVHYERWRLIQRGHEQLADRIEHTSKVRGDGAGYDVLSFEEDGRERFIEVKTTAYSKETPFFISDGELSFANSHDLEFHLYRVFEFRRAPRMFELRGRPDRHCRLDRTTYRASFS